MISKNKLKLAIDQLEETKTALSYLDSESAPYAEAELEELASVLSTMMGHDFIDIPDLSSMLRKLDDDYDCGGWLGDVSEDLLEALRLSEYGEYAGSLENVWEDVHHGLEILREKLVGVLEGMSDVT